MTIVEKPALLAEVRAIGFADEVTDHAAAAVTDADLVIIATPLSSYEGIIRMIAPTPP